MSYFKCSTCKQEYNKLIEKYHNTYCTELKFQIHFFNPCDYPAIDTFYCFGNKLFEKEMSYETINLANKNLT